MSKLTDEDLLGSLRRIMNDPYSDIPEQAGIDLEMRGLCTAKRYEGLGAGFWLHEITPAGRAALKESVADAILASLTPEAVTDARVKSALATYHSAAGNVVEWGETQMADMRRVLEQDAAAPSLTPEATSTVERLIEEAATLDMQANIADGGIIAHDEWAKQLRAAIAAAPPPPATDASKYDKVHWMALADARMNRITELEARLCETPATDGADALEEAAKVASSVPSISRAIRALNRQTGEAE